MGMVDGVFGDDILGLIKIIPSRVQIAVEARKIAAADLEPDAMTWREIIARGEQVDFDFINFIRFHPDHFVIPFSETGTTYPFLDNIGRPLRRDIHQFGCEVRVFGR